MINQKNKTLVSPSLLAADLLNLGSEIKAVEAAGADRLHLDIMDNHFVPNLTFGPELFRQVLRYSALPLDVHLMVDPVDNIIDSFLNAHIIFIHPEPNYHIVRSLQKIKKLSVKAGVAINPGTAIEVIFPFLDFIDALLIMTVNPGFGGQNFIPQPIEKIAKLPTSRLKSLEIQVDGGVNIENAKMLIDAGVNVLIAGSSIFHSTDYHKTITQLRCI